MGSNPTASRVLRSAQEVRQIGSCTSTIRNINDFVTSGKARAAENGGLQLMAALWVKACLAHEKRVQVEAFAAASAAVFKRGEGVE